VAGNEGMQRIEPSAPVYQEVARLYQIAKQLRPGGLDLWNSELYARFDDKWGGLGRDGTMRLNNDLVLRHLTGGQLSDDPAIQGQALATVLRPSDPSGPRRRNAGGHPGCDCSPRPAEPASGAPCPQWASPGSPRHPPRTLSRRRLARER
jgi:hypothetical protein